jgi:uncharacterized membrane protein
MIKFLIKCEDGTERHYEKELKAEKSKHADIKEKLIKRVELNKQLMPDDEIEAENTEVKEHELKLIKEITNRIRNHVNTIQTQKDKAVELKQKLSKYMNESEESKK